MADFNYYLNRAGIRGLQGVKGDQGDSPIITVQTETPNEYILKITNPDGTELISPNLRGNKININEGTYVRYNTETGELYTSTADGATGELAGVVRLATDADVTNMDERAAVTPSQLADALSQYLVSPDGSVKIVQNAENSLTELTIESTGQDIDQLKSDVSTLQNEVSVLNTEIDTKSPKLKEGENITLTPQDDGTIKIDSTGGLTELPIASANTLGGVKIGENLSITEDGVLSSTASGDVSGSGDNTFTGTNDFNGAVNLNGITIADNLTVTRNLTSSGEINAVSIKSTGIRSDDIKTTTNKKYLTEEDVDNQTIQIVEGKLHANLDELSNEVNSLSGDVTSLSGEVTDLSGRVTTVEADLPKKQNKLVQGDNITLTNNEDGTTTIAAGSTVPTNMVTTDTEQVIPSIKLFRHPAYDNGFTQIQGASISLLRYDREEVGRIDMGNSSKGIVFYCAGQDNMVFQMGGTSTRYFDFLALSGNIMNRMRYYGNGSYYDIFNAGNLIPSNNITISEASDTGVHVIDISKTLLDRISTLDTTVASLQTQIGEISAQLDAINGEVI